MKLKIIWTNGKGIIMLIVQMNGYEVEYCHVRKVITGITIYDTFYPLNVRVVLPEDCSAEDEIAIVRKQAALTYYTDAYIPKKEVNYTFYGMRPGHNSAVVDTLYLAQQKRKN